MRDSRPWFKAKTYGVGWGLPNTWQGWITYAFYLGLMAAWTILFPPSRVWELFIAGIAVLSAGMLALLLLKGEKPKWRWGR